MQLFDLCLAWNWEYDADFVSLLEKTCNEQGCSLLQVMPSNLSSTIEALIAGEIEFRAYFDRASDSNPTFLALEDWAIEHQTFQINPTRKIGWTHDKTAVHLAFLESGISTPYTFLIPSFKSQPLLPPIDLTLIGSKFAIKPATGSGGGEGVILNANSLEQVDLERRKNPDTKYILQAQLEPYYFNDRQAWFRVLVCNKVIHPCWWDPQSHCYNKVSKDDEINHNLSELFEIVNRITGVCKMDIYSSEISFTSAGGFLVVDYVNDPVDLRLQSNAFDGVPDDIVEQIVSELVILVKKNQP